MWKVEKRQLNKIGGKIDSLVIFWRNNLLWEDISQVDELLVNAQKPVPVKSLIFLHLRVIILVKNLKIKFY